MPTETPQSTSRRTPPKKCPNDSPRARSSASSTAISIARISTASGLMAPPHSWGGDPEGRRGSLADEAPPHSWGGGGEAAGGARSRTRLLPIHGEVARRAGGAPPEGLARKHLRLD